MTQRTRGLPIKRQGRAVRTGCEGPRERSNRPAEADWEHAQSQGPDKVWSRLAALRTAPNKVASHIAALQERLPKSRPLLMHRRARATAESPCPAQGHTYDLAQHTTADRRLLKVGQLGTIAPSRRSLSSRYPSTRTNYICIKPVASETDEISGYFITRKFADCSSV